MVEDGDNPTAPTPYESPSCLANRLEFPALDSIWQQFAWSGDARRNGLPAVFFGIRNAFLHGEPLGQRATECGQSHG